MQVGRGQLDGKRFTTWVMRGLMVARLDFTRASGRASMVQIDGFILVMKASTSFSLTVKKWHRGLSEPGGVAGMAEGLS